MRLDHVAGAAAILIGGLLWAQRFPAMNNHVPEVQVLELFLSGNSLKVTVQNTSSRTIRGLSIVLGKHRTDQDWSKLSGGGLLPNQTATLAISTSGLPVGGTRHNPAPPPPVELLDAVFADSTPGPVTRKADEPVILPAPVAPKVEPTSPTPPSLAPRVQSTPKAEPAPITVAPQRQPAPAPAIENPAPPAPAVQAPAPAVPLAPKGESTSKAEPPRTTVVPLAVPPRQPVPAPAIENPVPPTPAVQAPAPPLAPRVESTQKAEPAPQRQPAAAPAIESPAPFTPAVQALPPPALRGKQTPAPAPPEQQNQTEPPPAAAPARANGQPGTRDQGIRDELARLISLVEPFERDLASPFPRPALRSMVAAVVMEQNAAASHPPITAFDQGQRSILETFVYGLQTIQNRRDLEDDALREQVQRFLKNRRQSLAK